MAGAAWIGWVFQTPIMSFLSSLQGRGQADVRAKAGQTTASQS